MTPDSPAVQAKPAEVLEYIEDMLAELARLAEQSGERRLSAGIRLLAVQTARIASERT